MGYVMVNIEKGHVTRQIKRAWLWTAFEEYNGGLPLQLESDKFTVFKLDNVYGLTCKGVCEHHLIINGDVVNIEIERT